MLSKGKKAVQKRKGNKMFKDNIKVKMCQKCGEICSIDMAKCNNCKSEQFLYKKKISKRYCITFVGIIILLIISIILKEIRPLIPIEMLILMFDIYNYTYEKKRIQRSFIINSNIQKLSYQKLYSKLKK